jgi:hypothetical protein
MPKPWPLILTLLLTISAGLRLFAIDVARAVEDADADWQPGLNAPGMDGRAMAFCEYRGDLVIGGSFHTIGSQVIEHVARWDGTAWRACGAGVNGAVSQLTVQGDRLLAAGDFTEAGGAPANHIASWDGAAWRPLGDGVGGTPQALAVYRDTLFVGGSFSRAGHLAVRGIARWDGETWHDGLALAPEGPDIAITNLAVAGGHLVATWQEVPSGDPDDVPVFAEPHPVLWSGKGWDSISYGLRSYPDHLAVLGDSLYAAGYHSLDAEGLPPAGYYVTRWTGTEWLPLGREWGGDPGIPVGHAGNLYLARRGALYQWTGTEWIVASRPQSANFDVLFSGSDGLYSGGAWVVDGLGTDTRTARGLARWDGTAWLGVGDQAGGGLNLWQGTPQVILAAAGDGFSAAGTFLRVGDLQAFGLAQWDGSSWWLLPDGAGPFRANAFFDLGGRLTAVADELFGTGCWVRTLEDSRWKDLAWFQGRVLSITPWREHLVVGGDFAPEHIQVAPQVIIDPDIVLQSLGGGLNGTVRATCPLEASVVASGDFSATTDGRVQLRNVGLWDGSTWQPLGDGLPTSAITLEPFAGGVAAALGDGVLHWNGAAWVRLGDIFDGPVLALAVFEGELIAGGAFAHAEGVRLGGLARWRDGRWQPIGSGMNGDVQDLLVNGEEFWASGAFTAAGSVPSSGIANWRELRAGVESFYAHVLQDSVTLSWRDPESSTHRSTVVRWSPYRYPADPQDGTPLPFGGDGLFPASSGTVHSFRLALPLDGGRALYSVFAIHADGRSSAPGHARVRMPDRTPPAILLRIQRLADGAPRLAIAVRCSEPLVPTGVAVRLGSTIVQMARGDDTGTLWTGTATVVAPSSSLLTVCVHDSSGNETCAERGVAVAIGRPFKAGRCLVPDGSLLVEWSADTFASEGLVTVICRESVPPAFEVIAHEMPFTPLILSFRFRPDDSGNDDPRRLGVLTPNGSVQGGVYDRDSGRLVLRAPSPGIYQLVWAPEELSTLADPRFLVVAPPAPNPFRSGTSIRLDLLARRRVRVTVHDVGGRTVAVLFDGLAGPGEETIRWDGRRRENANASGAECGTAGLARFPSLGLSDAGLSGAGRSDVGPTAPGSPGVGFAGTGINGAGNGRALPSGVYFARVQTDFTTRTVRLVKVR